MNSGYRIHLFICICAAVVGCSGDSMTLAPVEGVVTMDGSPLAGVQIMFFPEDSKHGVMAIGTTDVEGKFEMKTGTAKGVVVGTAKVALSGGTSDDLENDAVFKMKQNTPEEREAYQKAIGEMQAKMQQGPTRKSKSGIPEKYLKPQTSGLSYKIEAKKNQIDIKLTP